MSAVCETCGKEFKNTQGLRGHKTFVHGQAGSSKILSAPAATEQQVSRLRARLGLTPSNAQPTTAQQVSKLEDRLEKLEGIIGPREPSELEKLVSITDEPLTEQVSELTKQVSPLTEQLNSLTGQLEISRVTKAMMDACEAEHKNQLEQLHNEWENAHNKLVGIINRNGELVKKGFLTTEDGTKDTNRQVNNLRDLVGQLEERVQSKLAVENQLHGKLDAMEQKLSSFKSELGVMRNLMWRQPTGKLVSIRLNDKRDHQFKEYRNPEGLKRPYRHCYDLLLGARWIDMAEPED